MSRRLVPVLGCVLATAFFGGFIVGSPVLSLLFVGPVVALLVYVVAVRRRPKAADGGWSAPPPSGAVPAVAGSRQQVAAALGRVECRELASNVWFGVGLGFLLIIFVAFAIAFSDDNGEVWQQTAGLSPWFVHPLAGMTVLAACRAVTRPARDGTEELFDSCPTEPDIRTAGVLRSAAVPALAFAAFLVVYGLVIYVRSPHIHGPLSFDSLALLLAGPVLAAGAVCLGAAVGSWVRFPLAPVVAVIAVGFLALGLATEGDPGWNPWSALSTMGPQADSPLLQSLLSPWWYLAWMVALSVVVAVVAVLRYRRDRPVWLVGLAGVVVAVVAAIFATSPADEAEAREVADLIARPAEHQTCEEAPGARVEICTYDGYDELRRRVAAATASVGRALPASTSAVTIRQSFDGDAAQLPAEVRELLPAGVPRPEAGEVWIGFEGGDDALLDYRLRLAFLGLGLEFGLDAEAPDHPQKIGGQARGVVALWLAARGLDLGDALGLATIANSSDDAFDRGAAWPDGCGPVVWSAQDLEAARALMRLPESEVAAVVDAGFARWSDPDTATDVLLAELDLPSAGPYDDVVSRPESYC